jgi:FkbM family methyltransferase
VVWGILSFAISEILLGSTPSTIARHFGKNWSCARRGWRECNTALVFDVGANVGVWSTHLVQMLSDVAVEIYAFEPVPPTFIKLVDSVERLGLAGRVHPILAAALDKACATRLSYSARNSLFAQVSTGEVNQRAGDSLVYSASVTLDGFSSSLGIVPALVKVDVEGSEVCVLRGAQHLLERQDRPALMLEYNPCTLAEMGMDRSSFRELLVGYALYYIDDFESQRRPFGELITSTDQIDWVCNMFAVPTTTECATRWTSALAVAGKRV